jgi:Domain of unknown function (DUF222)
MTTARELSCRLADLLRREHDAMADFLVALAEFDQRRLWAELGHANVFSYLTRDLGLSNGAAAYRKTAAELVGRYPEVAEALRRGDLCITSVVALAKVITAENRGQVLPRFFRLSKREAAEVVAELKPNEAPPMRVVVTAVAPPAPRTLDLRGACPPGPSGNLTEISRLADRVDANSTIRERGSLPRCEPKPATEEPLTADLRRLHLTVSKRFLDKLAAARDALSHSKPGATTEELLEAGLDLVLAQDAKRKALVAKPRNTPPPSTTDRVPAHMRRAVFERDGGRCQVPLASGGVCGSTYRVQIGHYPTPRALGGLPTLDNLRCECLPHNQEQANRDFGKPFMDQFRTRRRRSA